MSKAFGICANGTCDKRITYCTEGYSKPLYCDECMDAVTKRLVTANPKISDDSLFWATHGEITARPKKSKQMKID